MKRVEVDEGGLVLPVGSGALGESEVWVVSAIHRWVEPGDPVAKAVMVGGVAVVLAVEVGGPSALRVLIAIQSWEGFLSAHQHLVTL